MANRVEMEFGGKTLSIETGKLAKQADGAAVVRYGDTMVLVTAVGAKEPREGIDFFPLTVDYLERTYSAGKIPGGFFKREGRPTEKEVLTSRFIDRPLRPLFPDGFRCETQIIATVLSADLENNPDVLAILGASAALEVSDVPFNGPIAGVRVGRIDGKFICNPTMAQTEASDMELIVAGSRDAIVMVEGGANFVSENDLLEGIFFGHSEIKKLIELQEKLRGQAGKPKREFVPPAADPVLLNRVKETAEARIKEAIRISGKQERRSRLAEVEKSAIEALVAEFPDQGKIVKALVGDLEYHAVRELAVKDRTRIDGRGLKDIRPISCEVGILPRTHGSALFTRGETQAIVVTTLGTADDEQIIDALEGERYKTFMLHYNFPPFSTGETKPLRSPGRREVGHGALAERSVAKVAPTKTDFPYTVRIVSDILESNGSSSMASVCGGSLSMMDAGVPIKDAVAGIAMGLIKEGEGFAVLSDILGDEDHLGDMDFKVAGTKDGVTAVQMDIKIGGVSKEILRTALEQAREGRLHILSKMAEAITTPRENISVYAPRIVSIQVKPEKVREVIGPGGKVVKGIIEKTGVKIDIEDSGKISIASADYHATEKAIQMIKEITQEVEVGKLYMGTVRKIMDFGAFVEVLPGTDGLVHISQLAHERVKNVTDVLKEGDKVLVKVLEVDRDGKIRLSRKDALGQTLE